MLTVLYLVFVFKGNLLIILLLSLPNWKVNSSGNKLPSGLVFILLFILCTFFYFTCYNLNKFHASPECSIIKVYLSGGRLTEQ